jgi:hypothetical protein
MYSDEPTLSAAWSGVPTSGTAVINMAHPCASPAASTLPDPFLKRVLQLAMSCYGDAKIGLVNTKARVARIWETSYGDSINMKTFFSALLLPALVTKS